MTTKFKNFSFNELKLAEGIDRAGLGPAVVIRTGVFMHPKAPDGKFAITNDTLSSFKRNFDNNVRRLDKGEIAIDYGHDTEGKASGWITNTEHIIDGESGILEITPRWTKNGEQSIIEEEFKFLSADIDLEYTDNETGVNHGPTLLGAGLVNRPHIKNMRALFNEQIEKINEDKNKLKEFSMTPEEMMKKIGELEQRIAEFEGKLGAKTSALKETEEKMQTAEGKLSETEKQLSETRVSLKKIEDEKTSIAKEAKFSELLAAGKVLPAQKESFMGMDLKLSESFFGNGPKINLNDQGHGAESTRIPGTEEKSASDKVEIKASELMTKNTKLSLGEAYSQVLSEDKKLAAAYEKELNGEV